MLNNGYQQFIVVGKNQEQFIRSIEMINWEFEEKEENTRFKLALGGPMD